MSRAKYLAYRLLWAGLATGFVTVVLFLVAKAAPELAVEAADAPRTDLPDVDNQFWDPEDPPHRQYAGWLSSLVTLDWGLSLRFGESITGLLAERGLITLAYLVPAVLLGTVLATVFGYVAAARQGGVTDGLIRGSSYVVLAVPNFVLGAAVVRYIRQHSFELGASTYDLQAGLLAEWNWLWLATAAAVLSVHVAATQLRQVRAQSAEHLAADFTTVLRAKGRGPLGIAYHVLRAAAVPLASLFVAETVALLTVSVFVIEAVLGIPGIGYVTWQAASVNDTPLVLIVTLLVAIAVVLASVAEDLLAVVLDPRLLDEE